MKRIAASTLLIVILVKVSASFSLRVGDPRNSWYTDRGTIEEAVLTVEPRGLFMEYGLYLTFSSEGSYWMSGSDTLEVVLEFELPEEAVVFDSWLWVGDEVVRADLMDRWTASLIYEGIVKRRRDPSILTKQSPTQYELRVFPMAGNETRKVKIAYMMPTSWNNKLVSSSLPLGIINASHIRPEQFQVIARVDTTWANPVIVQEEEMEFEPFTDSLSGNYMQMIIPSDKFDSPKDIGFNAPLEDGLYFSKYQVGSEGIYQVAVVPSELIDTIAGNKMAVLVDYDASNTKMSIEALLEVIENELTRTLSPRDSFNLIFSNLSIVRSSENWIAATEENIRAAFSNLSNPLSSYSNLPSLLANGIEFLRARGDQGEIVLISDADQYNDFTVANTLINDILSLMGRRIPIHIADFQSTDFYGTYYQNNYYSGNGYLYTSLSKLTGGSSQRVYDGYSEDETINMALKYSGGSIRSYDLYTGMEEGFCHSRHLINGDGSMAYIHEAIMQVGRFRGTFPFKLEISGDYNNQVFSKDLVIDVEGSLPGDTLAEEIWTGQYIGKLESGSQSNDVINEIIYYSLAERVLSRYTSFLCLEPGFDPDPFIEGEDDRWVPVSAEPAPLPDSVRVYPNPFSEYINIEVHVSRGEELLELAVYDLTGAMVHAFDPGLIPRGESYQIAWDGNSTAGNPVQAGMYLLVFRTTKVARTIKLLKHQK